MKNQRGIVFFLTTVFAAGMLGTAVAQGTQGAAPAAPAQTVRPTVGVVDMIVLLRAHPKLNADRKDFITYQQGVATQLRNTEKNLFDEAKVVNETLKIGSPEHTQAMEVLERRMVEFRTSQQRAQREMAMRDMKIVYDAFKSIREEIQNFSVPRGFSIVLDVRGINPEIDELSNAQEEVGQTVVWNAPGVNMTAPIVQLLNQKFSQFPATANVVNGQVVFLETNNDGMSSPGPAVPNRPAPSSQPVGGATGNPSLPR